MDKEGRRKFLKKAATAVVVTTAGLGVGGWALKNAIEATNAAMETVKSPQSATGHFVELSNNRDTNHYSPSGEPYVVESGTEFTLPVNTPQGERKVGTGVKIVAATRSDGSKTTAFLVSTPEGDKQWLPVDPKTSPDPLASPYFRIISKDQGAQILQARYQLSPDGKDTFKLYPAKFNGSPVTNTVDKQP